MTPTMFEGFTQHDIGHAGVRLRARHGGATGPPPLPLLHRHPQTHAMCHAVVAALADRQAYFGDETP